MRGKKLNKVYDEFTKEMKQRLTEKQSDGWTGWDDKAKCPDNDFVVRATMKLVDVNADSTDLVDVANFAMFLYARQAGLSKCRKARKQ